MKILIENYTNIYSTEPIYLYNSFKKAGCESFIWDTNIYSAYDAIDTVKPDFILIRWDCEKINDILKYISENNASPKLIVNASGASTEIIKEFKSNKNCVLVFTNYYKQSEVEDILLLMPCVDLFLPAIDVPDYLIDAAICSENEYSFDNNFESYHKLYLNQSNNENFDLNVNLFNLASLYSRYKQFVLTGSPIFIFSQVFFDANARSNKVSLKYKDEDADDVKFILNKIFNFTEDENIEKQIKTQIKLNHTCLNRAKQLLSFMGNKIAISKLDNEINKIS